MRVIVLDSTKSLRAVLQNATTTTAPDFTVHYADTTTTTFTEDSNDGVLNGITEVTLVGSPASGTKRVIRSITINNRDSVAVVLTVRFVSSGGTRRIWKGTLQVNDTWTSEGVYDTDGKLKVTSTGGGGGEANTASNVGTAGVGVFKQKSGVDLEFKNIAPASNKVTVFDDTGDNEIDIDVVEANFSGIPQSAVTNLTTDLGNKQDDLSGLTITNVTPQGTDKVLIQDVSDADNLKYVTAQSIADLGSYQPLDASLTEISGLTFSNDDIIQQKAGVLTNRTPIQFKTDLALVKGDVGLGNVDNIQQYSASNRQTNIVDSEIDATGITTRSKLPSAIAYEDEANTYGTNIQTFTKFRLVEELTPANPPANTVEFYAFDRVGRSVLRYLTPSGFEVQIAQDGIYVARNNTGGTLTKGTVVYINGQQGNNRPTIEKAIATSELTGNADGVVAEDIATNSDGFVQFAGVMENFDTSAFTASDTLWVHQSVAGTFQITKPSVPPYYPKKIATVMNSHPTQGRIFISMTGVRGIVEGTNLSAFSIGSTGDALLRELSFTNSAGSLSLQADPTTNRTVTIQDGDGTLAFLSDISGSGEANTASNLVADSATQKGLFTTKSGVDLPFKVIQIGSTNLSIATDANNVTLDVIPANLTGIPQSGITNLTTDLSNKYSATNRQTNIVDSEIDATGITTRSKLPTALVYDDEANTFGSFDQIFKSSRLIVRNPADSFSYSFVGSAIADNRNIILPILTGNDIFVFQDHTQTLTNKTMSGVSNSFSNIPKTAISTTGVFAKTDIPVATVYTDQTNSYGAFNQVFPSSRLIIQNPAQTFNYTIVASAIGADRTLTIPLLTGNDVMVTADFIQTLTNKTINATNNTITDTSIATGDLLKSNGSKFIRFPIGSGLQVLRVNAGATDLEFATLAGGGDMVLADTQTVTGAKTFLDTTMKLRNVANTFDGYFVNTNTADRIYTLPDLAGTVALTSNIYTWTQDVDADGFDLKDLSNIEFRTTTGVPATSVAYILKLSGAELDYNIAGSHVFKSSGTSLFVVSPTLTLFSDINALQFNGSIPIQWHLSPDESINHDGTNFIFKTVSGGTFDLEVDSVTEYLFNSTQANFNSNNIINLGTLNTHPLPSGSGTLSSITLAETFSGVKTFNDAILAIRNPADTFSYIIRSSALTGANRDLVLPLITGTDTLAVLGLAQTFSQPQIFTRSATLGNINIVPATGDPSSTVSGDIWYNSSTNKFRVNENSTLKDMIGAGGSQTPWTSDIDADGFDLKDLSNIEFRDSTGFPANTVPYIAFATASGLHFNVPTQESFYLKINGTTHYSFSDVSVDLHGSDLRNVGFFESNATNPSDTGVIRLGSTESLAWRNNANSGNILLSKNTSDQLLFNSLNVLVAPTLLGSAYQRIRTNAGATALEHFTEKATISFIIDGGGSAITTGKKGQLIAEFDCRIIGWTAIADQTGSIVVDVNKSTYAGFPTTSSIAGSELPTLSAVQKNQDLALSTWTQDVTEGDVLEFEVDSATTVTRVLISLKVEKKG